MKTLLGNLCNKIPIHTAYNNKYYLKKYYVSTNEKPVFAVKLIGCHGNLSVNMRPRTVARRAVT